MKIIENTNSLEKFCAFLETQPFITLDLEFVREKTYYPELGLIQVACPDDEAVIDPLAPDLNLSSFFRLLDNPQIIKVFHSCRQDIEILYKLCGFIPHPLYDTQVAAQLCGFGSAVSYENLVHAVLHIELDKSCRLTNWCSRPLSEQQLQYALSDVTHLVHIYRRLHDEISSLGREHWIDEEMKILSDPETYIVRPENAWLKIRHHSRNRRFLTILQALAAWRETRAQNKNLPRQTIIKDECLLNIAAACPHDIKELAQIRNMRADILKGRLAQELVDIVIAVEKLPASAYIKLPAEKKIETNPSLFELLKLLLNLKSIQYHTVAHLIASENELKLFSSGRDRGLLMLKGWRRNIFGNDALLLRSGNLSLSYNPSAKDICFRQTSPG